MERDRGMGVSILKIMIIDNLMSILRFYRTFCVPLLVRVSLCALGMLLLLWFWGLSTGISTLDELDTAARDLLGVGTIGIT